MAALIGHLWLWQTLLGGLFCNDKWNKFASYGIWHCVFKQLFSRKILILDTDTSVFFRMNTDTDTSVFFRINTDTSVSQKHTEY